MAEILLTNNFKRDTAQSVIDSITSGTDSYYAVAARHIPYESGDDTTPAPVDSFYESQYDVYENGVFGKRIEPSDASKLVKKVVWQTGTVYDMYDHTDAAIFDKNFYVVVDATSEYRVFKVLDNNNGAASTVEPSNLSESACNFITTADGYTWKFLYKMDAADFEKFETTAYMPVVTSANVAGNTVSGAIDVIKINTRGSNYVATLDGQFAADDLRDAIPSNATFSANSTTYRLNANASTNTDFYVTSVLYISSGTGAGQLKRIIDYNASSKVITLDTPFTTPPSTDSVYTVAPQVRISGDGSGAEAFAIVNTTAGTAVNNFIEAIRVVNRGNNYTYATATLIGNTGGVQNAASVSVIIPPIGGHGSNVERELGARTLGLSFRFNQDESGFITTENDYRQIAILKNPLFDGVEINLINETGAFVGTEPIHQVSKILIAGSANTGTACTIIDGSGTKFSNLANGQLLILTNPATNESCLRAADLVSNDTHITLNSAPSFACTIAQIYAATITASAARSGGSGSTVSLTNTEPKFNTGHIVIGENSGSQGTIDSITINNKVYNDWRFFDNRSRMAYTANSGFVAEDATLYQVSLDTANARFHTANGTYLFFTNDKGPLTADPNLRILVANSASSFDAGSTKVTSDIVKLSGEVVYIENNTPITRSNTQSETAKIVIKF